MTSYAPISYLVQSQFLNLTKSGRYGSVNPNASVPHMVILCLQTLLPTYSTEGAWEETNCSFILNSSLPVFWIMIKNRVE